MNKKIFSDMKYAVLSQIVIVGVSFFRTIIIPKVMDVEAFGYWQIYLLYLSYVSIFYLGYNDGLYLRYVHLKKDGFTQKKFSLQLIMFIIMLAVEAFILILFVLNFYKDTKALVLIFVCLNIPLTGVYGSLAYYLQLTGRIKKYSIYSAIEKVLFCLISILLIFSNSVSLVYLIFIEMLSKLVIFLIILFQEKEIILNFKSNCLNIKETIKEFFQNINVGYKLMLGSYISLLFTGYCRIWIENTNSIIDFSYYAFALSLTNIITLVSASLATVIYPYMSKVSKENLANGYMVIETFIRLFNPLIIFGYFGSVILIHLVLPSYSSSIKYLGLLFMIVMVQLKISISNGTFYKVLREEKRMVFDNGICLVLLVAGCFLTNSIISNLFVQFLVLAYRAYRTDFYFRKKMNIVNLRDYLNDLFFILVFLIVINLDFLPGLIISIFCCIVYYIFNKKYIKYGISVFKS